MKYLHYFLLLFLLSCANRGYLSGGDKDETPPAYVKANPENNSIFFKDKKIKIYFDEYIKPKDIFKKLIISPSLEVEDYDIYPQGITTKYVEVRFLNELMPETTYTINFGNSIEDFNEGNPLLSFIYTFSTGSYIDSLALKGTVRDAFNIKTDRDISVHLYKIDSTYTDSIIYKEKPIYRSSTLDSIAYNFQNLKEGQYQVVALKDVNTNYLFDPGLDKIAFFSEYITLPIDTTKIIDSLPELKLFKEKLPFKWARPFYINPQKIGIGYYGELPDNYIETLNIEKDSLPSDFKYLINKDITGKDTLNFWFTNRLKNQKSVSGLQLSLSGGNEILFSEMKEFSGATIGISDESINLVKENDTISGSSNITGNILSVSSEALNLIQDNKSEDNPKENKTISGSSNITGNILSVSSEALNLIQDNKSEDNPKENARRRRRQRRRKNKAQVKDYELDSLVFLIQEIDTLKRIKVAIKNDEIDSLQLTQFPRNTIDLLDTLLIKSTTPIVSIDTSKIKIFDKDTLLVPYDAFIDKNKHSVFIPFDKLPNDNYQLSLFPNAIKDFWNHTNKDTINFKVETRKTEDYGNIEVKLNGLSENTQFIIQLLDESTKIIREFKTVPEKVFYTFPLVNPGTYYMRAIKDSNNNGIWDTGDFLSKKTPEEVIYFDKKIYLRANWDLKEIFYLNIPFDPELLLVEEEDEKK